MFKKRFVKIIILFLLISFSFIGITNSNYLDQETSGINTFSAGSVDFSLRDTSNIPLSSSFFNIAGMKSGDSETKTVRIKNDGSLDFEYRIWQEKTAGDDVLCGALQIEAKLDGVSFYNGNLSGLNLNPAATITGGYDDWTFILRLDSSEAALQSKSCAFNLLFKGWQIGSDGTWGLLDEESLQNNVTTGCWLPPSVPVLIYPTNPTYAGADSAWVANPYMDWEESITSCSLLTTITYQYESYHDASLIQLIHQSAWLSNSMIPAPGTPDGSYYWRVRAKDNRGYISDFSAPWLLVVDRVSPSASLAVSGSWTKAITEKVGNGGFETGDLTGWTAVGNVQVMSSDTGTNPAFTVTPYDGSYMARIGRINTYVWQNRLMQSFDGFPKSLSLYYNFFSRDVAPYDDPGFFIRLNGQEIFSLASKSVNPSDINDSAARYSGWQQFYYDLNNHTDSKINLALYAGNTGDTNQNSWVYVDQITTYFVSAPAHAAYNIFGSDPHAPGTTASGIDYCEYKIDSSDWIDGYSFSITDGGTHHLLYRCVDRAGNSSPIYNVTVITDTVLPGNITDLSVSSTTPNSTNLTWTAPGNDGAIGRASQYDVRYSQTATDCSAFNFDTATKVDKVASPQNAGKTESLEILGLNPATNYCFALKTADEAPNWSGVSNTADGTTASGTTVNAGDVIINELMWMGSSVSNTDKWLELRNMTNHDIVLSDFYLTKLASGVETDMGINFTGYSIPAHGYFLIAKNNNFGGNDSQLNVIPNIWNDALAISTSTLQIKLYWNDGVSDHLIDTAWNGTVPKEGLHATTAGSQKYYSMERTSVPGDGTQPLNWYTCIDAASTADFFDGGADERGTPGAANRSENEPLAHQELFERSSTTPSPAKPELPTTPAPLPTATPQPETILNISNDYKTLSFTVKNCNNYINLSYELTYDSDTGPQGIIGQADLDNQDEFTKDNLTLGTCSSGSSCVYHLGVKNIILKVDLEDKDNKIYSFFNQLNN